MDQRPDPLNDSALEREIESLLAIEPSPEFVARVRTHVANEPETPRWRLAWVVAPAMGACIVVFAAVMVMSSRPEPAAPVQAVTPSTVPRAVVERKPTVEPPRRVAHAAVPARRPPSGMPRPEVVISEKERQAFEQLLLALAQNRLPVQVRAEDPAEESLAPEPLEIEPLTIEPLQVTRLE
jgi:hypothetical protein